MGSRPFRIVLMSLLLSVCAPVMAATVTMLDNADGTLTVTITADGAVNIVALALDVDLTEGGNVTSVSIDTPCFNIFPDAAHELGAGYAYGAGTPICATNAPGEVPLPGASFTFCVGCLNGPSIPGADGAASVQFTLTFDEESSFCISENSIRGGIILTDGTGEDITNGTSGVVCGVSTCQLCWCEVPDCEEWIEVGMPASWMSSTQCHGDADGMTEIIAKKTRTVGYNDIDILVAGFNQIYTDPVTHPWIAADFDHHAETIAKKSRRVGYNDINILLAWFNQPGVPTDCDTTNPVVP